VVELSGSNDVTVVLVSKGLEGLLTFCLDSLGRSLKAAGRTPRWRTVVVDNASDPPYLEENYRRQGITLIRFDLPKSFAKANNFAVRRSSNAYYLLMNNDVLLNRNTVAAMLELLSREPRVGICGTRLLFPDGTIQHCGVVFGQDKVGPYHWLRKHPVPLAPKVDQEFQAVTGACMLIRREVWEELQGLDEDYPFGLEDIDFCLRARQRGWRVMCSNATASLHFEASTPGREQLDVPSRKLFMKRWGGRYTLDG
jgi:GT2 family glycosyltransferase